MVSFALSPASSALRVARDVRTRYLVKSTHSVALEEIAKLYTRPPDTANPPRYLAESSRFAENFTSHADGVRYVHDINKEQHVDFLESLVASEVHRSWQVKDSVYAIGEDGLDAFTLHLLSVSGNPLALMLRFKVNDDGQIEDLWRKRGLFQREIDALTKNPEFVLSHLSAMPQLELDEVEEDPLREARMLATVDKFFKEFDLHCAARDEDRWDRIVDFTTEDFEQWDATGVWKWPSGYSGVLNQEGLLREIDYLQDHFGASSGPGRTHAVMRAKAANSARNVAFLHFHVIGSAKNGPCALDKMVALTFNSDGTKVRQAMQLRSAASIQEYASVFKVGEECSVDA